MSEVNEVRLRFLKATEDQATVGRYIHGHEEVLLLNGVSLSKGYDYWKNLDSVYLLVAESMDGEICFGGARLHIWDGIDPLPLQSFLSQLEPRIYVVVDEWAMRNGGIIEIAGLWNSRAVAGLGLGSEHIIRTSIAAAAFLSPKSVFTFCSPFVSRFADDYGFRAFESLGDKGKFPFPDERWMSTINYMQDKFDLSNAKEDEQVKIKRLREKRVFSQEFNDRGKHLIIHFEI